jgi:cytochrome bd-type quinol oxidase subunit 2
MADHAAAITAVIAILAAFLISLAVAKYTIKDNFVRTRLIMSALFLFITTTLSISFWPYALLTFNYSFPSFLIGIILGQIIGVRTEQQKIVEHGIERYAERFARVSAEDVKKLTWWSIINFYSIMCGLVLINLIGFTNIILHGSPAFIIATSMVGALFVGSIVPYLIHLWTVRLRHGATR